MKTATTTKLAGYFVAVLLLVGCGGKAMKPNTMRAVDPSKVPTVTIACSGAASCMRRPECAKCVDCVGGFCEYQALGPIDGRTCNCYDGQVEFCYTQVSNAWKVGIKRCERQSDGVSFAWGSTCTAI